MIKIIGHSCENKYSRYDETHKIYYYQFRDYYYSICNIDKILAVNYLTKQVTIENYDILSCKKSRVNFRIKNL